MPDLNTTPEAENNQSPEELFRGSVQHYVDHIETHPKDAAWAYNDGTQTDSQVLSLSVGDTDKANFWVVKPEHHGRPAPVKLEEATDEGILEYTLWPDRVDKFLNSHTTISEIDPASQRLASPTAGEFKELTDKLAEATIEPKRSLRARIVGRLSLSKR